MEKTNVWSSSKTSNIKSIFCINVSLFPAKPNTALEAFSESNFVDFCAGFNTGLHWTRKIFIAYFMKWLRSWTYRTSLKEVHFKHLFSVHKFAKRVHRPWTIAVQPHPLIPFWPSVNIAQLSVVWTLSHSSTPTVSQPLDWFRFSWCLKMLNLRTHVLMCRFTSTALNTILSELFQMHISSVLQRFLVFSPKVRRKWVLSGHRSSWLPTFPFRLEFWNLGFSMQNLFCLISPSRLGLLMITILHQSSADGDHYDVMKCLKCGKSIIGRTKNHSSTEPSRAWNFSIAASCLIFLYQPLFPAVSITFLPLFSAGFYILHFNALLEQHLNLYLWPMRPTPLPYSSNP